MLKGHLPLNLKKTSLGGPLTNGKLERGGSPTTRTKGNPDPANSFDKIFNNSLLSKASAKQSKNTSLLVKGQGRNVPGKANQNHKSAATSSLMNKQDSLLGNKGGSLSELSGNVNAQETNKNGRELTNISRRTNPFTKDQVKAKDGSIENILGSRVKDVEKKFERKSIFDLPSLKKKSNSLALDNRDGLNRGRSAEKLIDSEGRHLSASLQDLKRGDISGGLRNKAPLKSRHLGQTKNKSKQLVSNEAFFQTQGNGAKSQNMVSESSYKSPSSIFQLKDGDKTFGLKSKVVAAQTSKHLGKNQSINLEARESEGQKHILPLVTELNLGKQANNEISGTSKILDLSSVNIQNQDQLIDNISTYIAQNSHNHKTDMQLNFRHHDLGNIHLKVTHDKKLDQVNLEILTNTSEGGDFFSKNKSDLFQSLVSSGLKVSDIKLDQSGQTKNSDFQFNKEGRQDGQQHSAQDERRNDSERRRELWELFQNMNNEKKVA